MFKAESIMMKEVISVYPETPIYDAMNIMVDNKVSGLPVVDHENHLVGILSEKDVLRLLIDEDVNDVQTVAKFMNDKVVAFSPDSSIVSICEFLLQNPFRRVPIISENKLVGVIARRDIITFILKLRSKQKKK